MDKEIKEIIIRYFVVLVLLLFAMPIIYLLMTPLTVYPSYIVLKAVYGAKLVSESTIFFRGYFAKIIPACVAGSAYFLLIALNLLTPMGIKTRFRFLSFTLLSFLIINVARIILFAYLAVNGFQYFDIAHEVTWYLGSTFLTAGIWLFGDYFFKIKEIPVYSDARRLIDNVR